MTEVLSAAERNARFEAAHKLQLVLISAREDAFAGGLSDDEISEIMLRELKDRHQDLAEVEIKKG